MLLLVMLLTREYMPAELNATKALSRPSAWESIFPWLDSALCCVQTWTWIRVSSLPLSLPHCLLSHMSRLVLHDE